MNTETKPCPVCGGEGNWYEYCALAKDNLVVWCQTCHGKGTIRPTQDPRYLFWAGIAVGMHLQYLFSSCEENTVVVALWKYAVEKCRAILANEPRRTTAKWRKQK